MPVQFQPLNASSDVTTTKTLLHEVIPITGSIVSGTYGTFPDDDNIKNYSHGMFQSVYDYPYLSSSANHIFDITVGFDEDSSLSGSTGATQESKKINMYNQFAQVLLGYTGSTDDGVRKFESDLILDGTGAMKEVVFVNFSRLLTKDQIKKGTFALSVGTGSTYADPFAGGALVLQDALATDSSYYASTVGGDYGLLYSNSSGTGDAVGNIFYQAGIAVITASVFDSVEYNSAGDSIVDVLVSSSISGACDDFRHRTYNISFNNTTEINSKIYFCRVANNKFNYSANPTYLSGSQIRIKNVAGDPPISYITTVGLYSSTGELLATAKLSEPLRKDPTNELVLRVRLDY